MARTTTILILCLLLFSLAALAQQSSPQTPENAYESRELIVWSQLQMPQPLPHKDKPEQPHDQQPKSPSNPHIEQEPIRAEKDNIPPRQE